MEVEDLEWKTVPLETARPEHPLESFPDLSHLFEGSLPGRRGLCSWIVSSVNRDHICVWVVLSKFKVDDNKLTFIVCLPSH